MSGHALLSASGAHRWLNCPPSARLTEHMPDKQTEYTLEGTAAHALGELQLRKRFTTSIKLSKYRSELKAIKADPHYHPEMDRSIEAYLDTVDQLTNGYPAMPYVAVEQRVDYSAYAPEGFGTCDCLIIGGDTLHVVDYKHGKGVPVDAEGNPQMRLYALGALKQYELIYGDSIKRVGMTVCQPRLDNIVTAYMSVYDLVAWGEMIKEIAQFAYDGKGDYREGDWCRWCKAKGQCAARAKAHTALEDFGFAEPPLLTPSQIGDLLGRGARLAKWVADVQEYALAASLDGVEIPGWKAVEGTSNRAFTDAEAAFKAAKTAGIAEAMLYERKPVTLAGLEKVMGKKPFADAIGPFVMKPPGKPTLVPLSDKREPITKLTAKEDFQEVP